MPLIDAALIYFFRQFLSGTLLSLSTIKDEKSIVVVATPTIEPKTKNNVITENSKPNAHADRYESVSKTKSVTFHPALVTVVYMRASTSAGEKEKLYFSRNELLKCREEEAKDKQRLRSIIEGQQKYRKCSGQKGNVTRVSLQISV